MQDDPEDSQHGVPPKRSKFVSNRSVRSHRPVSAS